MSFAYTLKSIWLFILGAILAVVGLVTLLTRPDMGSNPFIIMLMGLFFTGAGSIYGKRKLSEGPPESSPVPSLSPYNKEQQTPYERYKNQQQTQEQPYQGYPAKGMSSEQMQLGGKVKPTPSEQLLEVAEDSIEAGTDKGPPEEHVITKPTMETPGGEVEIPEPSKPEMTAPGTSATGRIIKIVVCPKCGAENETADNFCYKCGFKIKPDKKKSRKLKLPKKTVKKSPKKPAVKSVVPSTSIETT